MSNTTKYWIQEKAPAGNYFDSIGLGPDTTLATAVKQTKDWARRRLPYAPCGVRLVVRADSVIFEA